MSVSKFLHKYAGRPGEAHIATTAPEVSLVNGEVQQDAMNKVRNAGLGMLGFGAAGAGLIALKNWLKRPKSPSAELGLSPYEIDLPYPQFENSDVTPEEAEEIRRKKLLADQVKVAGSPSGVDWLQQNSDNIIRRLVHPEILEKHFPEVQKRLDKRAADIKYTDPKTGQQVTEDHEVLAAKLAKQLHDSAAGNPETEMLHNAMVDRLTKFANDGQPAPAIFSPRWLQGQSHMSPATMPWFLPSVTLASLGGLTGGASLVSWLAKKRRKAEQQTEMESAKKEYEDAMMAQYQPTKTHRLLSPKEAEEKASLDQLFDRYMQGGPELREQVKQASGVVNDALGVGTGAYATLASLLGLGTGYGMYKHLQSKSKAKQLEQALRDRAAVRATMNPPELYIHPVAARQKRPLAEEADAAVSATL